MISGAYIVYSLMFQMSINAKYDITKIKVGFQIIIPNGDAGKLILLLVIIIIVVLFAVYQMSKVSSKNNREVCYYKNLLKLLNDKKGGIISREENETNVSSNILKGALGLVIILQYIKKLFKK